MLSNAASSQAVKARGIFAIRDAKSLRSSRSPPLAVAQFTPFENFLNLPSRTHHAPPAISRESGKYPNQAERAQKTRWIAMHAHGGLLSQCEALWTSPMDWCARALIL
jgi:hypothetical protein